MFDTGLWRNELSAHRAQQYGLTVEKYKTKNVLAVEVTSADVAKLAADVCGASFRATTGAQARWTGGTTG